jgi:predicted nucleic acid-binding Zn ribbon protein
MGRGIKYFNNDLKYVSWTKHKCLHCANVLKTVKVSRVVDYDSPEAKDFDFDFGIGEHNIIVKKAKFVWKEFECPECRAHFTVDELKKIEGVYEEPSEIDEKTEKRQRIINNILFFVIGVLIMFVIWYIKKLI